jgi:hypothetical protein
MAPNWRCEQNNRDYAVQVQYKAGNNVFGFNKVVPTGIQFTLDRERRMVMHINFRGF